MHALPRSPARRNWRWLAASVAVAGAVTAAALHAAGGSCGTPVSAIARPGAGKPGTAGPAAALPSATLAGTGGTGPGGARPGDAGVPAFTQGHALFYDPGSAAGSCGLGPFPAGGWYVSLPRQHYAAGAACGTYLVVRGPRGTIRAEVVDLCPGCATSTINLSRAAFTRIAEPGTGTMTVSYRQAVDPPLPGPLTVLATADPTAGSLVVQIRNHGNPLTSVSAAAAGPGAQGWQSLSLLGGGSWAGSRIRGSAPFRLRIADAYGHTVVVSGITASGAPDVSTLRMYRPGPASPPGARDSATSTPAGPGRTARAALGCP